MVHVKEEFLRLGVLIFEELDGYGVIHDDVTVKLPVQNVEVLEFDDGLQMHVSSQLYSKSGKCLARAVVVRSR